MFVTCIADFVSARHVDGNNGGYNVGYFVQEGGAPERFILTNDVLDKLAADFTMGDSVTLQIEVFRSMRNDKSDFWRIVDIL